MSFAVRIDPDARLVRLTYLEAPRFDEWVATMESVLGSPEYGPGFSWLVDRRSCPTPDTAYIRKVSKFLAAHADRFADSRVAIVVENQAGYGMSRMEQILTEGVFPGLEIFTDMERAEAWLVGRPSPPGHRE
jgi:hypothetical protein